LICIIEQLLLDTTLFNFLESTVEITESIVYLRRKDILQ